MASIKRIRRWPKGVGGGLVLWLVLGVTAATGLAADWEPSPTERSKWIAEGRISPKVMDRLQSEPRVRVMAVFEEPLSRAAATETQRFSAIQKSGDRLVEKLPLDAAVLRHRFQSVPALALDVSWRALATLASDPTVVRIDLDEGGRGGLAQALPLVGGDTLQALGFSGSGVQVAVIDSGIDSDHPALAGQVIAERCFCSGGGGCCPGGTSDESGLGSAEDDHGHGTNVAGIVGATGVVAGPGLAPYVDLISVKVLDSSNSFCCTSDVIAGLDWIVTDRPDVDVVNMSLGTWALYSGDCDTANASTLAFTSAISALRHRGVLTTVSSMNDGSETSMASPACISGAISVGAVWDANLGGAGANGCWDQSTAADQITCFSNRNAQTDLFAPGARITSAGLGGGLSTYSGTSQAAPMVTGCVALMKAVAPGLTAQDIENALESSPITVSDVATDLSFPRLECLDAARRLDLLNRIGKPVPLLGLWGRWLLVAALGVPVAGVVKLWRRARAE